MTGIGSTFPESATRTAAVCFLHPGAGLVQDVGGTKHDDLPAILKARWKVRPGDRIQARTGCGEFAGEILAADKCPTRCEAELREMRNRMFIQLAPNELNPHTDSAIAS